MQKTYPDESVFSLYKRDIPEDITHQEFLSKLEKDFSAYHYNTVPDSVKTLRTKVYSIIGKDKKPDDSSMTKYQLQQCMHFCHMMDLESKKWGQSKGWWHTPFVLDDSKPLNTIEDYRHNKQIYNTLHLCRRMLDLRINLLPLMHKVESQIMDFLVFLPRSMYDFYDSKIKMYAGQYEAAVILVHLIHQLNLDENNVNHSINGTDEFCKRALVNEAIKNARYFIKESEGFDNYNIEIADIDYSNLIGDQCQHHDDNSLISRVCSYFNHKEMKVNVIKSMIDAVIFIKCFDRKQPLYDGTEETFYQEAISLPYIRYAAICLIIKADKEKMYFSSNKTGGNNKKLHIINELKKISRSLDRASDFKEKTELMFEMDYSFLKFISYYVSTITTTIEYEAPPAEGIKEYRSVRRHKWSLIDMLYTTLGNSPLDQFKYMLESLSNQIERWRWSSEVMGVQKLKAHDEYNRMKESGELEKL
ncbi:hypothetical protein [Serratia fonticola]|uniref:hypothetical protein n=1 Tax=Serratia fonticola TaxID=47917 RepID=UPI001C46B485|nr:hypothetical protein [Serratia fonticola]QXN64520.1 hypothetical protein J8M99_11060 [Serratia fonticola]